MAAARAVNTQTAVSTPPDVRGQIVKLVGDFVRRDVLPVASRYDKEDIYPAELVETMREMGLFGITIPERYGGLGLDYTTFAMVFEELSKGWMSVSGVIGTHHLMAYVIASFGTEDQKLRFLPRLASGELKGGLALTESKPAATSRTSRREPAETARSTSWTAARCSSPTRSAATPSRSWQRPIPTPSPHTGV